MLPVLGNFSLFLFLIVWCLPEGFFPHVVSRATVTPELHPPRFKSRERRWTPSLTVLRLHQVTCLISAARAQWSSDRLRPGCDKRRLLSTHQSCGHRKDIDDGHVPPRSLAACSSHGLWRLCWDPLLSFLQRPHTCLGCFLPVAQSSKNTKQSNSGRPRTLLTGGLGSRTP